jgi:hypothetical protein
MIGDITKFRRELRRAVADYIYSEGCGCCADREAHDVDSEALGKLLNVPRYSDGSGRDFSRYRTPKAEITKE